MCPSELAVIGFKLFSWRPLQQLYFLILHHFIALGAFLGGRRSLVMNPIVRLIFAFAVMCFSYLIELHPRLA